jgi:hypothetical protein
MEKLAAPGKEAANGAEDATKKIFGGNNGVRKANGDPGRPIRRREA